MNHLEITNLILNNATSCREDENDSENENENESEDESENEKDNDKNEKSKNPYYTIHEFSEDYFSWIVHLRHAIVINRIELIDRFLTLFQITLAKSKLFLLPENKMTWLDSAKQSPKIYSILINHPLFQIDTKDDDDGIQAYLQHAIKTDEPELIAIVFKFVLDSKQKTFFVESEDIQLVMKKLLEHKTAKIDDKNRAKIALSFAFLFGLENEFKLLIEEVNDTDDILDLFRSEIRFFEFDRKKRNFDSSHFQILKLALNRLNENAKLEDREAEHLLAQFRENSCFDYFKLIWNDKHFVRSQQWTQNFVFNHFEMISSTEFLEFLLDQASFSLEMDYTFPKPNQTRRITTEFRNCVWIRAFSFHGSDLDFDWLEKKLAIKWTKELFEWCLTIFVFFKGLTFLERNDSIDRSWWDAEILHDLILKCMKTSDATTFSFLMEKFPNIIDLTLKDHQFISHLFYFTRNPIFNIMFSVYESKVKFKSEKERENVKEMARDEGIRDRISKMKLISDA